MMPLNRVGLPGPMTLSRLLWRAGISRYEQYVWFRGCTLEKTWICCEDKALAESLRRCWLPQITQVWPLVEIRVQPAKPVSRAYRGESSSAHTGRLEY